MHHFVKTQQEILNGLLNTSSCIKKLKHANVKQRVLMKFVDKRVRDTWKDTIRRDTELNWEDICLKTLERTKNGLSLNVLAAGWTKVSTAQN